MLSKLKMFFNTVIHLKPKQVFYRLYYISKKIVGYKKNYSSNYKHNGILNWKDQLYNFNTYKGDLSFTFLNKTQSFLNEIEWNFTEYGELWTYNLNYFDFLNQKDMISETGVDLILDFIKNDSILKAGKEPYPISLRGMNWIKFLAKNKIRDPRIDKTLNNHYKILFTNIEYHLLGNHLLENAFSLLFGAYYFQDEKLYSKAKKLLILELKEQILFDGAHFELSPMYHQILFHRLLDCIQLIKLNSFWKQDSLLLILEDKASRMNSWLKNITYKNGEIPMVNDSAPGISLKSIDLFSYFESLKISPKQRILSDSGYRKVISDHYELFVDVGDVGPDYQPGHAHSDTFNFELLKNQIPIIVDTGVSTYEKNNTRQNERETASHNTVKINDLEQSEVWGGFRVARRAKIIRLNETDNYICASHNGYKSKGFVHERTFEWSIDKVEILDTLNKSSNENAKAFFHLHSSIDRPKIKNNIVKLDDVGLSINFSGFSKIDISTYFLSHGYYHQEIAYKLIITFDKSLKTSIDI